MSTIIKNAVIYTNNRDRDVIWDGAVAIEGSMITDVGPTPKVLLRNKDAQQTIDGKSRLVTPGFIDCHMHLDAAYLRGLIPPRWMGWLKTYFGWYFDIIDEEDFYYSAMFSIGKRLLTGTTTVVDAGPLPGFEGAAIRAAGESGIRANLNRITMDIYEEALGEGGFTSKHRESTDKAAKEGEVFVRKYNGYGGTVRAGLCLMQVPTTSGELGKEARRIAEANDGTLHTHAGVHGELLDRTIKLHHMRDVEYLDKIGVLCKRMNAAHMGWVTEDEMKLVQLTSASISHCPTSTTINGKGILEKGNIVRMKKMGVNVALGTDELDITDMVRVMFGTLVHRDIWMDSSLFPLDEVFDMATMNGAKAIGMGTQLGTIEKGRLADLILFNLGVADMVPTYSYSLLPNLITSASGAAVDFVMVNGRLLVENGKILSFDMPEIARQVQRRAGRYIEAAVALGMHDMAAREHPQL